MKRIDLFEFEDLTWFPNTVRQGGTDFLRFFLNATKFYNVCVPVLIDLLHESGSDTLLDLCSGGGGPIESFAAELDRQTTQPVKIVLSDKFPNVSAFRYLQQKTHHRIGFISEPVDALHLPEEVKGTVTMFSAIHHFSPPMIASIIKSAAAQKRGMAFFDGGEGQLVSIPGIVLVQPVLFALFTPFFKPFKMSRIVFTYLLPAIPLMTMWDGIASMLRLYKPAELLAIAKEAAPEYEWKAGSLRNWMGLRVTYLTGLPV
jgi:hypothetical protein